MAFSYMWYFYRLALKFMAYLFTLPFEILEDYRHLSPKAFRFRLFYNYILWFPFSLHVPKFGILTFLMFVKLDRYVVEIRNGILNFLMRLRFCEWNFPHRFTVNNTEVWKICGEKTNIDSKVVMLYAHGGAYFGETSTIEIPQMTKMSSNLGIPIYLVRYRLLPENDFDDSLKDMLDVYQYLVDHDFHVILYGVSAGGHLVLRLQRKILALKLKNSIGICMFATMFDFSFSFGPKMKRGYRHAVKHIYKNHPELDLQDMDFTKFPPIWMQNDLHSNLDFPVPSRCFAKNARNAGIDIVHIETKRLFHAIILAYGYNVPECEKVFKDHAKWVEVIKKNVRAGGEKVGCCF